jgi:hypothetical protein
MMMSYDVIMMSQALEVGDSVEVKYTGSLIENNAIGKVR